ncbi:hypothetical protein GGI07_003138 [Coemansia sp. Benny D115]|nr:hypothetical protein GGI07_003138 [Coemansia sp. Benny D115]
MSGLWLLVSGVRCLVSGASLARSPTQQRLCEIDIDIDISIGIGISTKVYIDIDIDIGIHIGIASSSPSIKQPSPCSAADLRIQAPKSNKTKTA